MKFSKVMEVLMAMLAPSMPAIHLPGFCSNGSQCRKEVPGVGQDTQGCSTMDSQSINAQAPGKF